ncbi:MAG: DUF6090 family protein [Gelidibacter sp.]
MIKLFKNIRKNMLKEGKTTNYLKYAIGEIILVVIGILIALQVNNYNDSLNQNDLEQKALHNLKLDFDYNQNELNKSIEELIRIKKNSFIILNNTGSKYQTTFDMDSLIQTVATVPKFYPQNGFLLDLINSGKLGIIKNDMLRNKLSSWLPALETLKDREKSAINFSDYFIKYIIKNGSWLNSDEATSDEDISVLKFPKSGFEINNNDLLKNIEFENIIENQIVYKSLLLDRHKKCLELNNEIIDLLEIEIKK